MKREIKEISIQKIPLKSLKTPKTMMTFLGGQNPTTE